MALGDMMGMMKQAKQLQEKMQAMQDEVAAMEIEGSAGGGLVKVTMNGKGEVKGVDIDPSLLKPEEAEIVEDLIVAACGDARTKGDTLLQDKMREMTGGMALPPGLKLPF
ncbi:MAG: YbaB/EbfC family nucleoid-associated protein [Bauldia sp.]|uniref:YbaB/EbfC family nucleoid-associated protein n=1 Tax=Bauldia sp. TaxID=2575872 RepID=UPI001D731DB5|nr:YbaB/EbfC family nucleoid-associated protein [Bauldia sp.]MCB1489423.1 YbaB/EbfC family nucleoid-associated protein [Bauldia sp.]MCB1495267.1 YbaB/EbfC family nucleoid-associated protein [Bauldia sp.]